MDIRLDTGFLRHHKTLKLLRRLGADAVLALLELWLWARENRPDGDLLGMDEEAIELVAGWPAERHPGQLINALAELNWIDVEPYGQGEIHYRLHEWEGWQPWAAGSEKRSEDAKVAVQTRWDRVRELKAKQALEADRIRPVYEPDTPSPSPSPSPPVSETDTGSKSNCPPCPHQEIIAAYHEELPSLPKVRSWTESSRAQLKARWSDARGRQTLEFWREYFRGIAESDFLCGRSEGMERPFKATLVWLIGAKNMEKVLNGQYENRPANGRAVSKVSRINEATIREMAQHRDPGLIEGKPALSPRILSDEPEEGEG